MLIKADDLCDKCRKIPSLRGMPIEEAMTVVHNNQKEMGLSDDDVNGMFLFYITEYQKNCPPERYCTRCPQKIVNILPK